MADFSIKNYDKIKKKVDWMFTAFHLFWTKVFQKNTRHILNNSENPMVQTGLKILDETCSNIADHEHFHGFKTSDYKKGEELKYAHDRYRRKLRSPVEFFFGMYYIDTAWRDIANFVIWRFKEEIKNNPELEQYIDNEVKKPELWYYNIWEDMQAQTQKERQKGKISDDMLSVSEHILVDETQDFIRNKILKEKEQRDKKHDHW
jgi:hypothetical protein